MDYFCGELLINLLIIWYKAISEDYTHIYSPSHELSPSLKLKSTIFRDLTPCILVEVYVIFWEIVKKPY
jgi:hypothetical protein